jgi:anti-sigma factor ChrR (cupin superfamily)
MNLSAIRNAVLAACVCVVAAQAEAPGVVAVTPAEMKWVPQGGPGTLPGIEQTYLVGDPTKPGPFTIRLRFPAGFKVAPHTHPGAREITILSGIYRTGYGETFDPAGLKTLPAGSFYTEPADVPHYIEIQEDVVVQISGIGPSGRKFVGQGDGKE